MATKVSITGAENIEIGEKIITEMGFKVVTPEDSNARSTDVSKIFWFKGRIIPQIGGTEGEPVSKLHQWSMVKTGAGVYRAVTAEYQADSNTVRRYNFPKAYVLDYDETFSDLEGTGTFHMEICEKKDENTKVMVEGGFAAE